MIDEILPGNKTRLKIIKAIYENPGINLTSLIKKIRASPNLVLEYVNKLSLNGIIKEDRKGGRKKIHIRSLSSSFDDEIAKNIYSLIEIDKRLEFFKKYKKLKPFFAQLKEIFKDKAGFVLVYGSHARFSAEEDSDLDLIIVGELKNEEIRRVEEIFITLEKELSLKIETLKKFLENKDKPLYINILKEHIVWYGTFNFIKTLAKIKWNFSSHSVGIISLMSLSQY